MADDDFNIDPVFFQMLNEKNQVKIENTKKEVQWNIQYHTLKLDKLRDKFYNKLDFEKFTVKACRTNSYVTTFRVQKMSEFLESNIE